MHNFCLLVFTFGPAAKLAEAIQDRKSYQENDCSSRKDDQDSKLPVPSSDQG